MTRYDCCYDLVACKESGNCDKMVKYAMVMVIFLLRLSAQFAKKHLAILKADSGSSEGDIGAN